MRGEREERERRHKKREREIERERERGRKVEVVAEALTDPVYRAAGAEHSHPGDKRYFESHLRPQNLLTKPQLHPHSILVQQIDLSKQIHPQLILHTTQFLRPHIFPSHMDSPHLYKHSS